LYHHLSGRVTHRDGVSLVLETGGVGYWLQMSGASTDLPAIGDSAIIFVHQVVRENDMFLCGFCRMEQRSLFQNLIKVSGVGPTMAMQMISQAPLQTIVSDVVEGNITSLTRIKGVGKKTAERMVLELRDKLKLDAFGPIKSKVPSQDVWPEDALLALLALGLTADRARDRLEAVVSGGGATDVNGWVRQALSHGK
jgi:Holliday junction DNA helicase RuvA